MTKHPHKTATTAEFNNLVQNILKTDLPKGDSIITSGRDIARDLQIGRTSFFDKMEVESEAQYKRQAMKDGRIMFHAHIGMSTWPSTVEALHHIYNTAEHNGFTIDRAGLCLDRRMGLPSTKRDEIPAETGPILETQTHWMQVGQTVPIQPHMGDFMIGFPASTENTINALKAGVSTIGNLSQFFAHAVPMWQDDVTTTVETVRALSLMGRLRDAGTLVHSYLEDGNAAHFHDCATVAGWAFLEKYIVEDLLGAKLAHCIGGLTRDPVKRIGWIFALNEIHQQDCIGSMFYGDTISFSKHLMVNQAIVGEYLLWDILAQLECPTGHALHPLPVTEAIRVPSAQEIADAHIFGRRIEQAARRLQPHFNFGPSQAFADTIVNTGRTICSRVLDGLKEAGVDINDPVHLLYTLKKLDPAIFESEFGQGNLDGSEPHGRKPVIPTDVYQMRLDYLDTYRPMFSDPGMKEMCHGKRLLIASTDVHAYAIDVITRLLREAGADVTSLGVEKNPHEVAEGVQKIDAEAILISTHNGMALDYAKRLKEELRKRNIRIPVFMGGVLNQKVEDQILPVDVTVDLKELGFHPAKQLESGFSQLRKLQNNLRENTHGTPG